MLSNQLDDFLPLEHIRPSPYDSAKPGESLELDPTNDRKFSS